MHEATDVRLRDDAQPTSDAELMARVRDGDRDAFGVLVDRYKDPLVNYLTRLAGSRDRAEDVAQEAFVKLYQSAANYREQGRLAPFLYRIATNLFRSEQRRMKRWRVLSGLLPALVPQHAFSPQQDLLRDELQQKLVEAVAKLPLVYRVPLVLRDVEDWSIEDIATATGCPTGTVKSRVSRARERLRAELAVYHGSLVPEGDRG